MTATDQLAALDAKVAEARTRYQGALDTFRRGDQFGAARDVLTPLFDYAHDIEARTREANTEELRKLTADACERIVEDGLVFHVPQRGTVQIVDPTLQEESEAALVALNEATNERNAYEVATRDEREEERKATEAQAIKEALASDDPDRIREALGVTPTPQEKRRNVKWHGV